MSIFGVFTARYCDAHVLAVTLENTCAAETAADAGFAAPSIVKVDRRGSTSTWDIYTCHLPVDVSVVVHNTVSAVTLDNNEHTFDYDCSGNNDQLYDFTQLKYFL